MSACRKNFKKPVFFPSSSSLHLTLMCSCTGWPQGKVDTLLCSLILIRNCGSSSSSGRSPGRVTTLFSHNTCRPSEINSFQGEIMQNPSPAFLKHQYWGKEKARETLSALGSSSSSFWHLVCRCSTRRPLYLGHITPHLGCWLCLL